MAEPWLEREVRALKTEIQGIKDGMGNHEALDVDRFNNLHLTLAGIGAEGTPLATRLDRLEGKQKDRSRLTWAILAVALTILGERLASHLSAKEPPATATNGGR